MSNHSGSSKCDTISEGTAFSICGGSLRRDDCVEINLQNSDVAVVIVDLMDVTGLRLRHDKGILVCRPWRSGDKPMGRLRGTCSVWTVESIKEAAMA